jgi:hypothetical protein
MNTSCLKPAAQTSQRLERSASPVTGRGVWSAGHVVRAGAGPARAAHRFWTVLLRSLAVAHA